MFPEYRDLIARLKNEDAHFARLFEQHNDLDHQIIRLQNNEITAADSDSQIETLKREKLQLKDQLHQILKAAAAQ